MVSSIIGNYLIEKGLITAEQLRDILKEQSKVRVKLGLIAVAEGLMTQEETERVNSLQAVMDKRFGDIAVEKGYLTSGQVESLLKKQGNAYLSFAQAMENLQLMTVEQLEQYLMDFKFDNQFTSSDMEAIKSDNIDRILQLYMPVESEKYLAVAGIAVRTLMRLIDTNIYPDKGAVVKEIIADNGALQSIKGEHSLTCALAGTGRELLYTASIFGKETFENMGTDALDSVAELLNCINGLYASAMSAEGVAMDMLPPEYSDRINGMSSEEMLMLPLHIRDNKVNLLIAVDHTIEMN